MSKSRKSAFTKFPNELLEEICRSPFNRTELVVLFALIRKTFGWHKEVDRISLSQFLKLTCRGKRNIQTALKRLEQAWVLVKVLSYSGKTSTVWMLNTSTDEWDLSKWRNQTTKSRDQTVAQSRHSKPLKKTQKTVDTTQKSSYMAQSRHPEWLNHATQTEDRVAQSDHHKINNLKETILKESQIASLPLLIEQLFQTILEDPAFKLDSDETTIIEEVCRKYPNTPTELLASFRQFLGTQKKMDRTAIKRWSRSAGTYLPQPERAGLTKLKPEEVWS